MIAAHGGGGFAFAGMAHQGSILATPQGVRPIDAATSTTWTRRPRPPVRGTGRAARLDRIFRHRRGRATGVRAKAPAGGAARGGPAVRRHGDRSGAEGLQYHAIRAPSGRGGPDRGAVTAPSRSALRRWRKPSGTARRWRGRTRATNGSARSTRPPAAGTRSLRWPPSTTKSARRDAGPRPASGGAAARVVAGSGARGGRSGGGRQSGGACDARLDRGVRSSGGGDRSDAGRAADGNRAARDFSPRRLRGYAAESEGARLRLASRIAAGGRDLDGRKRARPPASALGLSRLLAGLSSEAGPGGALSDRRRQAGMARPARTSTPDAQVRASSRRRLNCARSRESASRRPSGGSKRRRRRSCRPSSPWNREARPRPSRAQRGAAVRTARRALGAPPAMGDLALGPKILI